MTATDLTLELVSDPELIKYTHYQNSFTWKSRLTHEQYMEREWKVGVESKVGKRDEVSNAGIFHFVLRNKSIETNGDKFRNIVASCETRNRKAWKAEKGVLTKVMSPCIGSVYTIPVHRKKGYAHKMIELLNEYWLERLGDDTFMTLYSEVGDYYDRVGYKSHEIKVHHIPVADDADNVKQFEYADLEFEGYQDLIEQDNKELVKKLVEKSKTSQYPIYSLNMDLNIFTWYHLRDIFIGSILVPDFEIKSFGALLQDGSKDHIIWLHDWNSDVLTVIKLKFSSMESFKFLLDACLREAKKTNLKEVILWDSSLGEEETLHKESFDYISQLKGIKLSQPNGSLGAIRLTNQSQDYIWENNDKWCWF